MSPTELALVPKASGSKRSGTLGKNMNNPFFSFPHLSTERLVLRQPSMDDAVHLFEYRSHPEFLPVLRVPSFTQEWESQAHIFNRLKDFYNQKMITWIITQPIDLKCIGSVSLLAFPRDSFCGSHRFEISSEISPEFRGKGFVTEAKREIINWAFETNESLLRIHSEITS